MRVELKYASLPTPLGAFAVHYWLNVIDPVSGSCERWEVWQRKDAGGLSFGHLHCNLKRPDEGVGGGPAVLACQWEGQEALALKNILEKAASVYPHRDCYRPWPGPNSNTFVAWVLRQARVDASLLSWKALGKGFA